MFNKICSTCCQIGMYAKTQNQKKIRSLLLLLLLLLLLRIHVYTHLHTYLYSHTYVYLLPCGSTRPWASSCCITTVKRVQCLQWVESTVAFWCGSGALLRQGSLTANIYRQMAAAAATGSASTQVNDSTGIHRYKLAPPLFDGDYSKYEDWKHKFIAYMALQHADYTKLLKSSEAATTVLTDADLQTSAQDDDEARRWTSMSRDLHYILINICSGSAATVVRQQGVVGDNNGFETFRVLHQRFSLPVGTRSIGYLTTLLKPKFEEQSFEENFLQWEYDVARYELDNGQALPDTVKIAILLNETKGALQQHLQLRAGQVTTYAAMRSIVVEYYRATTTLSKLKMMHNPSTNNYNGPQPMDIGMTWKGYKGKGKGKYKGKNNKGRGKGYKGKSKGRRQAKGRIQEKVTEEATDK